MTTVTRIEIADLVEDGFGPRGASRDDLLIAAARRGADPRVLTTLETLPDRRFRTMRELWEHLPEVPLDMG